MIRTFAFLIVAISCAISHANAEPSAALPRAVESPVPPIASEGPRIATKDDIIGAWERVPLPPGANSIEPWPLSYQYFDITADGRIGWMMASENQKNIGVKELFQVLDHAKWNHYEWLDGGWLVISYSEAAGMKDVWLCHIEQKDHVDHGISFKAGDLMMTLYKNDAAGKARGVYYRLLRRLPL